MDTLKQFENDTGCRIINLKYEEYENPNFRVKLLKNDACLTIEKNINLFKSDNNGYIEEIIKIIKDILK